MCNAVAAARRPHVLHARDCRRRMAQHRAAVGPAPASARQRPGAQSAPFAPTNWKRDAKRLKRQRRVLFVALFCEATRPIPCARTVIASASLHQKGKGPSYSSTRAAVAAIRAKRVAATGRVSLRGYPESDCTTSGIASHLTPMRVVLTSAIFRISSVKQTGDD